MGEVVLEGERVDHAEAGAGVSRLAAQPVEFVDGSEGERVGAMLGGSGQRVEEAGDVGRGDRPERVPTCRSLDLNERFKPEETPGAGPDQGCRGEVLDQCGGNVVGAHGPGRGVPRDEHPNHDRVPSAEARSLLS